MKTDYNRVGVQLVCRIVNDRMINIDDRDVTRETARIFSFRFFLRFFLCTSIIRHLIFDAHYRHATPHHSAPLYSALLYFTPLRVPVIHMRDSLCTVRIKVVIEKSFIFALCKKQQYNAFELSNISITCQTVAIFFVL